MANMADTTRRDFVKHSAAATAAAALGASCTLDRNTAHADARPMIDCHIHLYDPTRPQGPPPDFPPPGDPVLYRPTLPDRFIEVAAPHGVTSTVVVEASTWPQDNDWVLELAEKNPVIVGLVGNLVPGKPQFAAQVRRLSRNPLFRGIRIRGEGNLPIVQGLRDSQWVRDLQLLAEHDLALDVAGWSGSPADFAALAQRLPDLRIVINHVAGAKADGKPLPAPFRQELAAAAAHPNVFCKISGLVESTGAREGKAPRDPAYYAPTIDAFWETFGEDRLIYGSNWPVSDHAAPYAVVFNIVDTYFTAKSPAARRKYFTDNALAAYKPVLKS